MMDALRTIYLPQRGRLCLRIQCPPRPTLFPYTTLFRSPVRQHPLGHLVRRHRRHFQAPRRSEEHTSELQSRPQLVCRLLHEKKTSSPAQGNHPTLPNACLTRVSTTHFTATHVLSRTASC